MLIGYKALLIPIGWIVLFCIVGLCAWHDWKEERKTVRRWVAVFFFLGAVLMSTKVAHQLLFRYELHSLRNANIAEVRVNGEELRSANARDEVVVALNRSTFLDPRDGGPIRSPLRLEVRLRSGETHTYSVARYHDGASIMAGPRYAYSTELVSALDKASKPLPNWP